MIPDMYQNCVTSPSDSDVIRYFIMLSIREFPGLIPGTEAEYFDTPYRQTLG